MKRGGGGPPGAKRAIRGGGVPPGGAAPAGGELLCLNGVVGPGEPVDIVLVHGAGSTPDFVLRSLGAPLVRHGLRPAALWLPGHGPRAGWAGDLAGADPAAELIRALRATGARFAGGVSLGAHVVASAAASLGDGLEGVLLVLPAWTGDPRTSAAAQATRRQAEALRARGLATELARIRTTAPAWVADELTRGWLATGEPWLAAALAQAARSRAPTGQDLAGIRAPAGLVALGGDPLHPAAVARYWARRLPRARLETVATAMVGLDRTVLGEAAWRALAGCRPVTPSAAAWRDRAG